MENTVAKKEFSLSEIMNFYKYIYDALSKLDKNIKFGPSSEKTAGTEKLLRDSIETYQKTGEWKF